jgi:hypothetical protein
MRLGRVLKKRLGEGFAVAREKHPEIQGMNDLKLRFFPAGAGIFDRASLPDALRMTILTSSADCQAARALGKGMLSLLLSPVCPARVEGGAFG